jgi:predicted TIM-barrel fold metal-dependent hydrolase
MNDSPIVREYLENGCSETCPIIDIHGHIGCFYGAYLPSAVSVERMIHSMDRAGVRLLVCSHHTALTYDVGRGNALMQEVIRNHPGRFLGYWVINPNHPDIIRRDLENYDRLNGFVGLKFWADYHLVPITSPKYSPALEFANERELLMKVHTFGGSPFNPPEMLGEIAAKYPRAQFFMAHCGYGDWETSVAVARDLPNVYLDLTSVVQALDFALMPGGSFMPSASCNSIMINGLLEHMVGTAGSKKVLFGSDLPWYSQTYHAGAILFARISDDDRHNILHRNAERLLEKHLDNI